MARPEDRPHVVAAQVERREDGEVWLHLLRDEQEIHLEGGEEFLTVALKVNPWVPAVLD